MLAIRDFHTLIDPSHLPNQDRSVVQLAQQKTPRSHFLCYVVYGDSEIYYEGVKLSVLSFLSQIALNERPTVVILSQRPDFFATWQQQAGLDIINLTLSNSLFNMATQDNYHYRLKTLGLAYLMQLLCVNHIANQDSKFLFFDSDTYFLTNPLPLYEKIDSHHVVMYKQEARIFARKKYRNYLYGEADKTGVDGLQDKAIGYMNPADGSQKTYDLKPDATMYSSLIMGVQLNAIPYLLEACNLMYPVRALSNARTVEQFCFAEIFRQHFTIVEGKNFVNHFSRRRQKAYVAGQMAKFWQMYPDTAFDKQLDGIKTVVFERPLWMTLAQATKRLFKPEPIR